MLECWTCKTRQLGQFQVSVVSAVSVELIKARENWRCIRGSRGAVDSAYKGGQSFTLFRASVQRIISTLVRQGLLQSLNARTRKILINKVAHNPLDNIFISSLDQMKSHLSSLSQIGIPHKIVDKLAGRSANCKEFKRILISSLFIAILSCECSYTTKTGIECFQIRRSLDSICRMVVGAPSVDDTPNSST